MPYSETKGQFWADPVNPARVGPDLNLPPAVVQPEVALPLDPAWDYKRFLNLGAVGGAHCVLAVARDPAAPGGQAAYHLQLLTWSPGQGFGVAAGLALPPDLYVYDARALLAGGKVFAVVAGSDYSQPEPAPWLRPVELLASPGPGLALHPAAYVMPSPAQYDSTYHVHLAVGRRDDEVVVLHDYHDSQYLAYRAYALAADGTLGPLCAWTPLPGDWGPAGPGVQPEFEILELEPADGLYLASASKVGATETEIRVLRFDAAYGLTVGQGAVTIPGARQQALFAHPLGGGRVAVGVTSGSAM